MPSMSCVPTVALLQPAMGGEGPVVGSLHPCFVVCEVSLVHITLHPLLASLVHPLFSWLWVIISLHIAPSLKHSSMGWPAC